MVTLNVVRGEVGLLNETKWGSVRYSRVEFIDYGALLSESFACPVMMS